MVYVGIFLFSRFKFLDNNYQFEGFEIEIELHNYLVIYMPNLNNANWILTNCKNNMNAECF